MKFATPEAFDFTSTEVSFADSTSSMASRFFKTVSVWRQRSKSRAQLAGLSSHSLQDIGITRVEANVESKKPFWKE